MGKEYRPYWADQIPKGCGISSTITYTFDIYDKRFDLYEKNGIKYYLYDPTKYGYEKNKKYPLLVFMHGYGNAGDGIKCITGCGAEQYASDKYQKLLGGAYILIPMANELKHISDEEVENSWSEKYVEPVKDIILYIKNEYCEKNGGVYKCVLFGNSTGAEMTYRILDELPTTFSVLILSSPMSLPTKNRIDEYNKNNLYIFFALSKHDEYINYKYYLIPKMFIIKSIKHLFLFLPDWIYNGKKQIQSNYYRNKEMGQHCTICTIQYNLLFDDGTPMDPRLPYGLIDWINFSMNNKEYPKYNEV